jgi:phosphatidylglycerol---prolipoprotein diacylglyceryl transferase
LIHVPTNQHIHIVFDLLAWGAGGLTGWWHGRRNPKDIARLDTIVTPSYFFSLAIGALIGAWFLGSLNSLRWSNPTLSHSVGGALAGGILGVEIWKWRKGIAQSTGGNFVLPMAVGIMVGRFGCFFAGIADQTFGTPTSLPWAVEIGDGIGRHPVQLYEATAMGLFALWYIAQRKISSHTVFYSFIGVYAAQRFIWEFLKPYPPVMLGLNVFHFLMLGLLVYAIVYARSARRSLTA